MTLSEMIDKCIMLLGTEYAVAEEDRLALREKLCFGINAAYQQVARDYCPPLKEEICTLDANRYVSFSQLSEKILDFRSAECDGMQYLGRMGADRLFIAAPAGSRVTIRYYYLPQPLSADDDVPAVSNTQMSCEAYIYGALSLLASQEGRHTDAAAWEERQRAVLQGTRYGLKRMPLRRWQ